MIWDAGCAAMAFFSNDASWVRWQDVRDGLRYFMVPIIHLEMIYNVPDELGIRYCLIDPSLGWVLG
jgi:hypothetical protein